MIVDSKDNEMIDKLKQGAALSAGVDHEAYSYRTEPVPDNIRKALICDLD